MAWHDFTSPPAAMALTRLARGVGNEIPAPWQPERKAEPQLLRTNWVVLTGSKGSPAPRMHSTSNEDGRIQWARSVTSL